jgi:hypothetical protein
MGKISGPVKPKRLVLVLAVRQFVVRLATAAQVALRQIRRLKEVIVQNVAENARIKRHWDAISGKVWRNMGGEG